MPSQRKKYYKNDFILRSVAWSKNAKDTGCDKVALSSDKMEWCKGEIASSTDFTALGSEWINIKCCCTWDHRTFITRSTKDSKPPCRKQDRKSRGRQEIQCMSFNSRIYLRLKYWTATGDSGIWWRRPINNTATPESGCYTLGLETDAVSFASLKRQSRLLSHSLQQLRR
jgi:hypothetical protein